MASLSRSAAFINHDLSSLSIETLLQLKTKCIKRFDYEFAKKVQGIIEQRKACDINKIYNETIEKVKEQILKIENDYKEQLELIATKYQLKHLDLLFSFNQTYKETQSKQIRQLVELEMMKKKSFIKAEQKLVKESQDLLEESQRYAKANKFDEAVKIREESQIVKNKIIAERKTQISQKFDTIKAQTIRKQRNTLTVLAQKLQLLKQQNEERKLDEMKAKEKSYNVSIILVKQNAIASAMKEAQTKQQKQIITEKINRYFNQRITNSTEKLLANNSEAENLSQSQLSQSRDTTEVFINIDEDANDSKIIGMNVHSDENEDDLVEENIEQTDNDLLDDDVTGQQNSNEGNFDIQDNNDCDDNNINEYQEKVNDEEFINSQDNNDICEPLDNEITEISNDHEEEISNQSNGFKNEINNHSEEESNNSNEDIFNFNDNLDEMRSDENESAQLTSNSD